ncbi:MAG TPA: zinc ribbon domain-containing protein [Anaerolineales bacterium]|nr:zinc ribbon domain-containing protein [Anaerolineales bacterium]
MMLGGGLMMVVGLLFLLLVIGIPILLVVALAGGGFGIIQRQNHPVSVTQSPVNTMPIQAAQTSQPSIAPSRYCSHCGAGLQANWTHCPQCGAPIS